MDDLRAEVTDRVFAHRFAEDWRGLDLPPATRAALGFAEKLTRSPGAVQAADVEELRRHGFSDEEIHDVVQIVAYFNYINRVAQGLGVPPEPNMEPWEEG